MTMRIIANGTQYDTRALKHIACLAFRREGYIGEYRDVWNTLHLYVAYGTRPHVVRVSDIRDGQVKVYVPRDGVRASTVAALVLDAVRSVGPYTYAPYIQGNTTFRNTCAVAVRFAFADTLYPDGMPTKPPKEKPTVAQARERRLQHTRKLIAQWQTKLKRATNALRKLRMTERRIVRAQGEA